MSEEIYKEIDADGSVWWFNNHRKIHRVDGPAIEYADGSKEWYQNGYPHRTDGPAIEYPDGNKYWYQYGKFHRTDGPAIECPDGRRIWFQNGECIKTCYSKPLTIEEKKIFICCVECAKIQNISEEKFYKLKLLL